MRLLDDGVQIDRRADGSYLLRASTRIEQPRDEVFAFFADAANLEAITPAWLAFRVLTPPPIAMRAGALIDYRLALHRVPLRWRTRIASWEPPRAFVDEQVAGPYLRWRHEHVFVDLGDATEVLDRVDYRPRGGRLAHGLLVGRDLRRIFGYRRAALARLLAPGDAAGSPTSA